MVDWQLNKTRVKQDKLIMIGMPFGFIFSMILVYFMVIPELGVLFSIFFIIILIIMYGPVGYLAWKYLFAKNPKFVGLSKDGIYFSNSQYNFDNHIYWSKIKDIKPVKNQQGIDIKTIFLMDGSKRKLTGIDKDNIKRIENGFETYQ